MSSFVKHRGKRTDNGEWVKGYYFETPLTDGATGSKPEDGWYFLTGKSRHCISKNNCVYEVDPESVGLYSGFNDKNGKEIYTSDVIALVNADSDTIKVVCEYGTAKRDIYGNLVEIHGFYFRRLCDDKKTFPIIKNYAGKHDTELIEVIGNLKDNPELLVGNL